MATFDEAVIRVVTKYEGRGNARAARRDLSGIEDGAEKLNVALAAAGAGFLAFTKSAVNSFGEIETAMARFASRAGWSLRKFTKETAQATHDIARLTGVRHSLIIQGVQEGISQGALLGMPTKEVLNLVREGAKLHAAGQTNLLQAVSSAITSRQYGAPSAPFGQRLIYSASQVGAGNPAEYGKEYKDIAPGGNILNIEQSESLGALALIAGAAPSLAEGATWIKALYRTMSNPMQDAENMFEERMGYDWSTLIGMLPERGGLNKVLQILATNFSGVEHMEMFGRQEAVQGLTALTVVPGQLLRLQNAVRQNAIDDPVARAWSDNINTWRVNQQRFQRSMDTFLRSFGQPVVFVLNRVVDALRGLLDGLTWLNETFRGVPALVFYLAGAMLALRAGLNIWRSTAPAIGRLLEAPGGLVGALIGGRAGARDREREEARDARDRENRNWNTAAEAAVAATAAGGSAWYAGRKVKGLSDVMDAMRGPPKHRFEPGTPEEIMEDVLFRRHARQKRNFRDVFFGREPYIDDPWYMDPEDLKAARAAWMKREGRTLGGAGMRDGSRWTMFGDGWAAGKQPDFAMGGARRRRTYWEGRGAGGWLGDGLAGWADVAMFEPRKRPGWWKRQFGDQWDKTKGYARHIKATTTTMLFPALKNLFGALVENFKNQPFGVARSTLHGILLGAFIGGFKWWWKQTSQTTDARYAYSLAAQRSALTTHLSEGGSLADAPLMGDIDASTLRTAVGEEALAANAESFGKSMYGTLNSVFGWIMGVDKHHDAFAQWDAEQKKNAKLHREHNLELWNTILNGLNRIFHYADESARERANELTELNRSLAESKRTGLIPLMGVEVSQDFADLMGESLNAANLRGNNISDAQKARYIADQLGTLPVYDPREIRGYAPPQLDKDGGPIPGSGGYYGGPRGGIGPATRFDQRLSGDQPITIVINVDQANATPEEIAEATRSVWRNIGNEADRKSY